MIDFENRLGMRIGLFSPSGLGATVELPDLPILSVERWVGGITDRSTRAISNRHAGREAILIEAAFPDLLSLSEGIWTAANAKSPQEWVLEQIRPSSEPSPNGAKGLVISCIDVDPRIVDEFNAWYDEEHMPLLDRVPGMLSARRFRAIRGVPTYLAIYHLESLSAYKSQVWIDANTTPWIRRIHRFRTRTLHLMFERA